MTTPPQVGRHAKPKRARPVLLGVGIVVVVILGVVAVIAWLLGLPRVGPSTVSTRGGVVSLDVPAGWTAHTPWNARQIAWQLVGGPYRVEDIKLVAEDGTTMWIYLDVAPRDVELAELHRRDLDNGFRKGVVATTSPVRDLESLASRSGPRDDAREIVTARSQHYVVTIVVDPPGENSLQAANQALATLTVRDDR